MVKVTKKILQCMEIAVLPAVSQMSNFRLSVLNYNLSLPIWAMIHPYFGHWVQLLQQHNAMCI